MTAPRLRFIDRHPHPADFRAEVLRGLTASWKSLAPKFFYDSRGSRLFEAICETPEYYPTRTELGILALAGSEITAAIGPSCALIEPGSGNSQKLRFLLEDLRPEVYMPLDIAQDHLLESARTLAAEHPWLHIHAVCMDYGEGFDGLDFSEIPSDLKRVVFFPGSTIGNFEPAEALLFLRRVAAVVGRGGGLLIGVDLKKDPAILHRAYNDADGITRKFNLNLLHRINDELGADFDVGRFYHYAFYQVMHGRIEMHLISRGAQVVRIGEERIRFGDGESIHTESSYKYTIEQFRALAAQASFDSKNCWCDPANLFSVHYFETAA